MTLDPVRAQALVARIWTESIVPTITDDIPSPPCRPTKVVYDRGRR